MFSSLQFTLPLSRRALGGQAVKVTDKLIFVGAFAALTIVAVSANASETITYTYDSRGRLVKVERSGTVNNNVSAEYKYDKGDNRTNVNVVSPN